MKCTYCSKEIPKGTGTMYVTRTGTLRYYCSSRCFKSSNRTHKKINKKEVASHLKQK